MDGDSLDQRVRRAAFDWLAAQSGPDNETLSRDTLAHGFDVDGNRVRLVGPQGIFKPRCLELPLSITTAPNGPYDDNFGPQALLRYRYRGDNRDHPDNRGLRELMRRRWPLVYLYGLSPGCYLPVWPVFIVADNPPELFFTVEVEDAASLRWPIVFAGPEELFEGEELRRRYVTMMVRRRIHQQAFRERVLGAYRRQCALCRLRHQALLDAAHITADGDEDGEPVISNGVALCKLHHAAYDKYFISITPDYIVQVRQSILDETDGPMLEHGLKGLDGKEIIVPSRTVHQPDKARLSLRHRKTLEFWRGGN